MKHVRTGAQIAVICVTVLLSSRSAGAASRADGDALLAKKGCLACHSIDGTKRVGPTFARGGTKRLVITRDGETKEVTLDAAYIARSIRDPDAEIVSGFPRSNMPRFDLGDDEIASIVLAIGDAGTTPDDGARSKPTSNLVLLGIASFAFVALHLILSSIPVRERLIGALEQRGFAGDYVLAASLALGGMIYGFVASPYVEVWVPPRALRWIPITFVPFALLYLIAGFTSKGPTAVGQAARAKDDARGIFTITRHPALWGFTVWSGAHLLANGELRAILFFSGFFSLAILGMLHIDRRRAIELGDGWSDYARRTSRIPFVAIATGRAKLDLRGIGLVRIAAAALVFAGILLLHARVIGASPFP